jgi:Uncharacterised protein family, YAP/Alf4/glomulin
MNQDEIVCLSDDDLNAHSFDVFATLVDAKCTLDKDVALETLGRLARVCPTRELELMIGEERMRPDAEQRIESISHQLIWLSANIVAKEHSSAAICLRFFDMILQTFDSHGRQQRQQIEREEEQEQDDEEQDCSASSSSSSVNIQVVEQQMCDSGNKVDVDNMRADVTFFCRVFDLVRGGGVQETHLQCFLVTFVGQRVTLVPYCERVASDLLTLMCDVNLGAEQLFRESSRWSADGVAGALHLLASACRESFAVLKPCYRFVGALGCVVHLFQRATVSAAAAPMFVALKALALTAAMLDGANASVRLTRATRLRLMPHMIALLEGLAHVLTRCPLEARRRQAYATIGQLFAALDSATRYRLLLGALPRASEHIGGLFVQQLKQEVAAAFDDDDDESGAPSKSLFASHAFVADFFPLVFRLRGGDGDGNGGASSRLLDSADDYLHALNFYRFLLLRDANVPQERRLGLASSEQARSTDNNFVAPLSAMIDAKLEQLGAKASDDEAQRSDVAQMRRLGLPVADLSPEELARNLHLRHNQLSFLRIVIDRIGEIRKS